MRTIVVMLVPEDTDVLEARVANALSGGDALVAVCHKEARSARQALTTMVRHGAPIVIFDDSEPRGDPARLEAICRNVDRHFRPDVLRLLSAPQALACESEVTIEQVLASKRHTDVLDLSPEADGTFWSDRSLATSRAPRTEPEHGSGVLGPSFHLAEFYLDLPPFRHIARKYRPGSVLDVGCGLGGYLMAFRQWGARDVQGVDGFVDHGEVLCGDVYRCHDLRRPLDLGRTFDLVISTEVLEHIPADHEADVLETIRRHARDLILFSAAVPGQPGVGHVNCRPLDSWLAAWRRLGWEPDIFDSIAVRSLGTYHWFRRNLLVLRPRGRGRASNDFGSSDLVSREAECVPWTAQAPMIHVYPLDEPLPRVAERADPAPTTLRGET